MDSKKCRSAFFLHKRLIKSLKLRCLLKILWTASSKMEKPLKREGNEDSMENNAVDISHLRVITVFMYI